MPIGLEEVQRLGARTLGAAHLVAAAVYYELHLAAHSTACQQDTLDSEEETIVANGALRTCLRIVEGTEERRSEFVS